MKHIKMKKQDAEKWLQALRSGKYAQGDGLLYDHLLNTYCCLGVLCHVIDGKVELERNLPTYEWLKKNGIQFFGFHKQECQNPFLEIGEKSAANMNDFGISFQDIANYLEEEIETYD